MPDKPVTVHSAHDEVFVVTRHAMRFSEFGDIPRLSAAQLPRLRKELRRLEIEQAGPDVFIYTFSTDPHGGRRPADGDFVLELALPVAAEPVGLSAPFAAKRVSTFRYIAMRTTDFSQWTTLRDLAEENGLTRSLVEREVVLSRGATLADSVIELQEGVA